LNRIMTLMGLVALLAAPSAAAAVVPDAVPDAPAPFAVGFRTASGPAVQTVTVSGLRAGVRVGLSCRSCLGQTSVGAVAGGARHVFRPKLRLNGASRLTVTVAARNFTRVREWRVVRGRLRAAGQRCSSVADNRRVRCGALRAPRPWATVNVCSASAVGVRAASPAGGRARETVAARFRLQYADGARWVDVPDGASPWTTLGRANRAWQGGYTFRFGNVKGRTFRGLAEFEWRRGSTVVRRSARLASPRRVAGYSSSVCAP
jgi:hypothetical protein